MGTCTDDFWGWAQRHSLWSLGSALLITTVLCTSLIDRTMASAPASEGVNRTVANLSAPRVLSFSSPPSDAEFLRTGLFVEPLSPVVANTPGENRDLARALLAYQEAVRQSGANDAVEPLVAFLAAHPDSPWKPALQLNLGIIYRQTGHFSKALDMWEAGWRDAEGLSDPRGRALANAMVARLSQLEAYLGRKELLQPLLDSIQSRSIGGTAAQLITDSHTGLYEMQHDPEHSFRCGPLALTRILTYGGAQASPVSLRVLHDAQSTAEGLSLDAVQRMAVNSGMDYQMAFREPGAAVILPTVAHWKVGHYAALVAKVDGRYLVQDTTFGDDIRVSPTTLDEEASGYFLIPAGPLPAGWRRVSAAEGGTVWGRGDTGSNHDQGATGPGCDTGNCTGGGSGGYTTSAVELEVVGLQLHDAPVGYAPPRGQRVNFDLYYSHRDTSQLSTSSFTNFGPRWLFSWLSYISYNILAACNQATLNLRGGGLEPLGFSSCISNTSTGGAPYSHATVTSTVDGSGNPTSFTLTYPDGSFAQYDHAGSVGLFMSAVGDAAGNIDTLTYDSQTRITSITDAIGQVSTLSYTLSGSPLAVTKITDPFGRSATFSYNSSGQLASITDVLGITSSYTYGQGTDPDFINTLTTPYGSTTFTFGDSSTNSSLGSTRFLKTVDPLNRTSYVEYDQSVDAGDSSSGVLINSSLLPTGLYTCNNYLNYRNTFVFDANEYALASGPSLNYSLAKVIHWLHTSDEGSTSRFKESEKQPLENRVWYNYPAQLTAPCDSILSTVSSTGVVTNGATNQPSAIGRVLDNGTTQLQTFQYNSSGNVTQATDPVGRQISVTYATNGVDRLTATNTTGGGSQLLETRTYNGQHLPLTIIGANGKTAHYQYNSAGQPTRYTDPQGHATAMTYDGSGHLKTVQGPITGSEYSYAYDNVGRVADATDPAGRTVHFTYDAADRLTEATYPDGTNSKLAYTLLDLTSSTDRLQQKTSYSYDADRELVKTTDPLGHSVEQGFNLAGRLDSITDAKNHTTTLVLDDQSRLVAKQYANGTMMSIVYDNSISLVASVTDALGQVTDYTYNPDNTTAELDYSANQATPSVSFSYDPAYRRVVTMSDGIGNTTYSYYPVSSLGANQLHTVSSPVAAASGHDILAYTYDALNRVVGYKINGVAQSIGFDALGRITSASNPLDTFTYSYSDATSRVTAIASTQGPPIAMSYFGPTGDELLQQIKATTQGGTTLAQFGYTYNSDDNVASFSTLLPTAYTLNYAYDKANRLLSSAISGVTQKAYGYDPASNLSSITANGSTQNFSYTSTNSITSGTYDAAGNPTVLGGNTYTWDGANRIVSFAGAANKASTFTYDGVGRLVRIVDTTSGTVTADHSYFWCGSVRCLAHDNTQGGSPVSTQYFAQGAIASGTSYYYVKDTLGSVRQLVTSGGTVAVQYGYDPYGNQTTVSGTAVSDIGYAGYFYHASSGLDFALYRAYDPAHARWLNRDPIGEAGGINIYAYVDGNPVNYTDPTGQCPWCVVAAGAAVGAAANIVGSLIAREPVTMSGVVGGAAAGAVAVVLAGEVVAGTIVGGTARAIAAAIGDTGISAGMNAISVAQTVAPGSGGQSSSMSGSGGSSGTGAGGNAGGKVCP